MNTLSMKRSFVNTNEPVSYAAWKGSQPGSTRSSSSQKRSIHLGSPKNNVALTSSNKEFTFPSKKTDGGIQKPPQVRYELVSDENASHQPVPQQTRPVSASQTLTLSMGSPKGLQKIKFAGQKRGSLERSNTGSTQQNPLSSSISASMIKTADAVNLRSSFNVESKKGKQGGLQISTDLSNVKYPLTHGGASTTVARSQTLKPKDINQPTEGQLKKSVSSSYNFDRMLKPGQRNNSTRPTSSQDKAKPQTANSDANVRKSMQKCHTLEDEQEKHGSQKSELLNKLLAQSSQKAAVSPKQKPKTEAIAVRPGKQNNFFSNNQQENTQEMAKNGRKANDQPLRQVQINAQKAGAPKEVSLTVEKFVKDENHPEEPQQGGKADKASLQSFVTKVSKGSTLSANITIANTTVAKKPTLNFDETGTNQQRPPRGPSSKTPKTTTNAENRVFTFESRVLQNSGQVNVNASQELRGLTAKAQKATTTATKASKEEAQKPTLAVKTANGTPFIYYVTSLEKHHRKYSERDYFCQLFREHFAQTFQAMMLVKYLKTVDPQVLHSKMVNLPRRSGYEGKKTVVFDLDETLIHCNESLELPYHVKLPITFPHGEVVEAGINIRPYAVEALKELSKDFEIIVFTASHGCYANVVLDYLDPKGQYVHHRLFRESCVQTEEGIYVKDLRVLANRNLNDVVLIDNAAYSFAFQIDNGIPIAPYYDNPEDEELKHLIPYLKFLNSVKDLKEVNRQNFKLHMYSQYESMEEVLENVVLAK